MDALAGLSIQGWNVRQSQSAQQPPSYNSRNYSEPLSAKQGPVHTAWEDLPLSRQPPGLKTGGSTRNPGSDLSASVASTNSGALQSPRRPPPGQADTVASSSPSRTAFAAAAPVPRARLLDQSLGSLVQLQQSAAGASDQDAGLREGRVSQRAGEDPQQLLLPASAADTQRFEFRSDPRASAKQQQQQQPPPPQQQQQAFAVAAALGPPPVRPSQLALSPIASLAASTATSAALDSSLDSGIGSFVVDSSGIHQNRSLLGGSLSVLQTAAATPDSGSPSRRPNPHHNHVQQQQHSVAKHLHAIAASREIQQHQQQEAATAAATLAAAAGPRPLSMPETGTPLGGMSRFLMAPMSLTSVEDDDEEAATQQGTPVVQSGSGSPAKDPSQRAPRVFEQQTPEYLSARVISVDRPIDEVVIVTPPSASVGLGTDPSVVNLTPTPPPAAAPAAAAVAGAAAAPPFLPLSTAVPVHGLRLSGSAASSPSAVPDGFGSFVNNSVLESPGRAAGPVQPAEESPGVLVLIDRHDSPQVPNVVARPQDHLAATPIRSRLGMPGLPEAAESPAVPSSSGVREPPPPPPGRKSTGTGSTPASPSRQQQQQQQRHNLSSSQRREKRSSSSGLTDTRGSRLYPEGRPGSREHLVPPAVQDGVHSPEPGARILRTQTASRAIAAVLPAGRPQSASDLRRAPRTLILQLPSCLARVLFRPDCRDAPPPPWRPAPTPRSVQVL